MNKEAKACSSLKRGKVAMELALTDSITFIFRFPAQKHCSRSLILRLQLASRWCFLIIDLPVPLQLG
jgi:hypothetical protein